MTEQNRRKILVWVFAILFAITFVWLFKGMLLPFALGMVIAYVLNPLVQKLCRTGGMSRGAVVALILFWFFCVVASLVLLAAHPVQRELSDLADNMPDYIDRAGAFIQPYIDKFESLLGHRKAEQLKEIASNNMQPAIAPGVQIMAAIAAGGMAIAHAIGTIVIMPIVSYFMMKEWPHITGWVTGLLPLDQKKTILDLLKQIDRKLNGFFRGQLAVMFILGVGYSIALSIAGLKYGVLIGVLTGFLTFIPFVGTAFGFITSISVAFFQSGGDVSFMAIIAAIFISGQLLEGNFITPLLVGGSVGLHPLWIFFALLAGGSLFGILGMILAVPVAAIASVLIGFAIGLYKNSTYYKGKK